MSAGSVELETPPVADVRELLATRSVCESVAQIWKLAPKNMHNSINRVDFHNIVSCIAKVLLVGFDDGELFDLVQKEWDSVAGFHSERMHCITFARCLVQLAVLWLDDNGKSASNVARFIDSLAVSISVLEITKRDNSMVRVAPSIRQTHFLGHVSERVTFDYQPEQGDDIRRKLASFSEVLPVARLRMFVHHQEHSSRKTSALPTREPLAFGRLPAAVEDDPSSNRSSHPQPSADGQSTTPGFIDDGKKSQNDDAISENVKEAVAVTGDQKKKHHGKHSQTKILSGGWGNKDTNTDDVSTVEVAPAVNTTTDTTLPGEDLIGSGENQIRDSPIVQRTRSAVTEATGNSSTTTTTNAATNVNNRSSQDDTGSSGHSLLPPPAGFADALLSKKDLLLDVGKARERWARLRMSRQFLGMWKTFSKGQHVFDLGNGAQDIRFSTLSGLLAKRKIHMIEAKKTQPTTGHTPNADNNDDEADDNNNNNNNNNSKLPRTGASSAGSKERLTHQSGKRAEHHRQSSDAGPLAALSQQFSSNDEEKVNTPTPSRSADYDFEFRDGTLVPAVKASSSRSRLFAPSTATRHHLPPAVLSAVNEAIDAIDAGNSFSVASADAAALASRSATSVGANLGKKKNLSDSTLSKPPKLSWAKKMHARSTGLPWAGSADDPENVARTLDAPILRHMPDDSWRVAHDFVLLSGIPAVRVRGPRGSGVSSLARRLAAKLEVEVVSGQQLLHAMVDAKQQDPFGILAVADHHYHADPHFVPWKERLRRLRKRRRRKQKQAEAGNCEHEVNGAAASDSEKEDSSSRTDYEPPPHVNPDSWHSVVTGVTCSELDAVVAHLLRGHSIPTTKCREMVHSRIVHTYLESNDGFVIDDDVDSAAHTSTRTRDGASSRLRQSSSSSGSYDSVSSTTSAKRMTTRTKASLSAHPLGGTLLPLGLQPRVRGSALATAASLGSFSRSSVGSGSSSSNAFHDRRDEEDDDDPLRSLLHHDFHIDMGGAAELHHRREGLRVEIPSGKVTQVAPGFQQANHVDAERLYVSKRARNIKERTSPKTKRSPRSQAINARPAASSASSSSAAATFVWRPEEIVAGIAQFQADPTPLAEELDKSTFRDHGHAFFNSAHQMMNSGPNPSAHRSSSVVPEQPSHQQHHGLHFSFPAASSIECPGLLDGRTPLFGSALLYNRLSDASPHQQPTTTRSDSTSTTVPPPTDVLQVDGRQAPNSLVAEVLHLMAGSFTDVPHPNDDAVAEQEREQRATAKKTQKPNQAPNNSSEDGKAVRSGPDGQDSNSAQVPLTRQCDIATTPLIPYALRVRQSLTTFALKMPNSLMQGKGKRAIDKRQFFLRFGAVAGVLSQARHWSRFGQYCPVAFLEEGVVCQGQIFFAAVHRGEVYLLSSAARLQRFLSNADLYTHRVEPHVRQRLQLLFINKSSAAMFTTMQIDTLRDAIVSRDKRRLVDGAGSFTDEDDVTETYDILRRVREAYSEGEHRHDHLADSVRGVPAISQIASATTRDGRVPLRMLHIARVVANMYNLEILDTTGLIINACKGHRTVDAATLLLRLALSAQAPAWQQQAFVSPETLERFVLRPILARCHALFQQGRGYLMVVDRGTFFPSCAHHLSALLRTAKAWEADVAPGATVYFQDIAEEMNRSRFNKPQALLTSPRSPSSREPSPSPSNTSVGTHSSEVANEESDPTSPPQSRTENQSSSVLVVPKDEYVWQQRDVSSQVSAMKAVLRKEVPKARVHEEIIRMGTTISQNCSFSPMTIASTFSEAADNSIRAHEPAIEALVAPLCRQVDPFFMTVEMVLASTHSIRSISDSPASAAQSKLGSRGRRTSTAAATQKTGGASQLITATKNALSFGPFGYYCPVSWIERGVLVPMVHKAAKVNRFLQKDGTFPASQYAEVDNEVYVFRGKEELDRFQKEPWKYLGGMLPRGIPRRRDVNDFFNPKRQASQSAAASAFAKVSPRSAKAVRSPLSARVRSAGATVRSSGSFHGHPVPIIAVISNNNDLAEELIRRMVGVAQKRVRDGSVAARAAMPAQQRALYTMLVSQATELSVHDKEDAGAQVGRGSVESSSSHLSQKSKVGGFVEVVSSDDDDDSDLEKDVDDYWREYEQLRTSEHGGFVNWSGLDIDQLVELLRAGCYPTFVLPFLCDDIETDDIRALGTKAARTAAQTAASKIAAAARKVVSSGDSERKDGKAAGSANGGNAPPPPVVDRAAPSFGRARPLVGDLAVAHFGIGGRLSRGGLAGVTTFARMEHRTHNRWASLANVVQSKMGVLRAVGIDIFTPWIKQRGKPTTSTARRVMMGLLGANVMDVAGAPIRCNISPLGVGEARALLERGYYRLGKFGLYCPVESASTAQGEGHSLVCNINYPVEYRGYLFFPSSEKHRRTFLKHADRYLFGKSTATSWQQSSEASSSSTAANQHEQQVFVNRNVVSTCAVISATDGDYPANANGIARAVHNNLVLRMSKCRALARAHALRLSDHSGVGGVRSDGTSTAQPIHVTPHDCILWILGNSATEETGHHHDTTPKVPASKAKRDSRPPGPPSPCVKESWPSLTVLRVRHLMRGYEAALRAAVKASSAPTNGAQGGLSDFYTFLSRRFSPVVLAQAVALRLRASDCRLRGWVMSGYPRCSADAAALAAVGIVPTTVVALVPASWPDVDLVYGRHTRVGVAKAAAAAAQPAFAQVNLEAQQPNNSVGFTCAVENLEAVCTYYSSRFTDVVCRLNVFPADMALKDEQRQLSTLQQRAFAFDRNHPFTASLSPYFQLLRQRLAVKLQQRRRAAAAMKRNKPTPIAALALGWQTIHALLDRSKFGFMCPVAWGERREYVLVGFGASRHQRHHHNQHQTRNAQRQSTMSLTEASFAPFRPRSGGPSPASGSADIAHFEDSRPPILHKRSRSAGARMHVPTATNAEDYAAAASKERGGELIHFESNCMVYYQGHLFACESARQAAKLRLHPEKYLSFQTPPGTASFYTHHSHGSSFGHHRRLGSTAASSSHSQTIGGAHSSSPLLALMTHSDPSTSLPAQLSPLDVLCRRLQGRFATSHTEDDFCPVTLLEQSTVCNVSHDCAVEFRDKVYFLANQRCMLRFLAAPERYQLKVRHVEKCPPPVVTRRSQFEINRMLHRHGLVAITPYLEQSLSPYLQEALTAFAADGRPTHPCLSKQRSVLMYVALFLKSRNRSTSEKSRSAWQLKLELFLKDCSHAEFIQNHAARGSPKNVARSNLKSAPGTGGGSGGNGHGSVPRNSSQAGVGRARRFLPDSVTDGGDGMHEMQRRMAEFDHLSKQRGNPGFMRARFTLLGAQE